MKILISCFEPFGDSVDNSSLEVVKEINSFDKYEIKKVTIPVTYLDSFRVLRERIESFHPDYIILTGQAASRKKICLEKYGYNFVNSKCPDNNNQIVLNQKIINSSQISLSTKFNLSKVLSTINDPNVIESVNAGGFVCNFLYFSTLHNYQIPCLFIHFPLVKNNDNDGLPKDEMINTLNRIIQTIE